MGPDDARNLGFAFQEPGLPISAGVEQPQDFGAVACHLVNHIVPVPSLDFSNDGVLLVSGKGNQESAWIAIFEHL